MTSVLPTCLPAHLTYLTHLTHLTYLPHRRRPHFSGTANATIVLPDSISTC